MSDQDKIKKEVFAYNMLGIGEPETNGRYESRLIMRQDKKQKR